MEKLKTGLWFARRPRFWRHGVGLVSRKLTNAARHELRRPEATRWATDHAVSPAEALQSVGLYDPRSTPFPRIPKALITEAVERARNADIAMGGPADLELLYATVLLTKPRSVIETGVAYGWSSLVILSAMERNGIGKLVSVDMPYVKRSNEPWVGVVVPESLRHRWTLIREPDRNGLAKAIARCGGQVDLTHYDSDKSYSGRMYAYPMLWNALRAGGMFISDDIQDNLAFRNFCDEHRLPFNITEANGKFVGLVRKRA